MNRIPRQSYGIWRDSAPSAEDPEPIEQEEEQKATDCLVPIDPFWARASLSMGLPEIKEDK